MSALLLLDIPICVPTVHSSCHHQKHEEAICKSNSAFNDMGNHLNLLEASLERRGGACSSFRSETQKIAALLRQPKSFKRSRFEMMGCVKVNVWRTDRLGLSWCQTQRRHKSGNNPCIIVNACEIRNLQNNNVYM